MKKSIGGTNTIRFRMLKDDARIQLDLTASLNVDRHRSTARREPEVRRASSGAVFVDFPERLKTRPGLRDRRSATREPARRAGRFGGIAFRTGPGRAGTWINTACQHIGASVWWPNKDQLPRRGREMRLRVAIPSDLVDVSNGKFLGKTDLGDGYTRWDWLIQYPINNYSVSLNIGQLRRTSPTTVDGHDARLLLPARRAWRRPGRSSPRRRR
ncbi:MAG: hypothetical protein MZV63_23975 [Marinilabiliales bacterium]|nr:hypothetical protein [Marinilabiliales bacterium]